MSLIIFFQRTFPEALLGSAGLGKKYLPPFRAAIAFEHESPWEINFFRKAQPGLHNKVESTRVIESIGQSNIGSTQQPSLVYGPTLHAEISLPTPMSSREKKKKKKSERDGNRTSPYCTR